MQSKLDPSSTTLTSTRRPRKSGPKVKTGCLTCKCVSLLSRRIRRIKCDEKRPECLKCVSTGRRCDGYTPLVSASTVSQAASSVSAGTLACTTRTITTFPSDSTSNIPHLEYFYHCAGPALSNCYASDFWSRTVLQVAHSSSAIRHATIALSYLCRTQSSNTHDVRPGLELFRPDPKFLHHYNKAIRDLILETSPAVSPRVDTALIACVLFICIEFLRGDYTASFKHISSGLLILHSQNLQPVIMQSGDSSPSSPGTQTAHGFSPLFSRMATIGLLLGMEIPRPGSTPQQLPAKLPMAFQSTHQAHESLVELMNASLSYIRSCNTSTHKPLDPFSPSKKEHHQSQLMALLQSWMEAFQALERDLASNLGSSPTHTIRDEKTEATLHSLHVLHGATAIWLSSCNDPTHMLFDQHATAFRTLIAHADCVTDIVCSPAWPRTNANFTLEMAIIAPLHFVATRCRCPVTRRAAVALLARNPPREGLWDARQCRVIAERVIQVEEEPGLDEAGWPTRRARLRQALLGGDLDEEGWFSVIFETEERRWVEKLKIG